MNGSRKSGAKKKGRQLRLLRLLPGVSTSPSTLSRMSGQWQVIPREACTSIDHLETIKLETDSKRLEKRQKMM